MDVYVRILDTTIRAIGIHIDTIVHIHTIDFTIDGWFRSWWEGGIYLTLSDFMAVDIDVFSTSSRMSFCVEMHRKE